MAECLPCGLNQLSLKSNTTIPAASRVRDPHRSLRPVFHGHEEAIGLARARIAGPMVWMRKSFTAVMFGTQNNGSPSSRWVDRQLANRSKRRERIH